MEKVIVAITTYNLKEYIEKALDSVLMQKTNFPFKIIIADDASTDGTIDILLDYKKKYEDKIEVLLAEKNMGSLSNSNRLFHRIDCEYFSFLDGDDYWVDECRLQRQVDFLDSHPEYAMCAGNTQYLCDGKPDSMLLKEEETGKGYCFQDMLDNKMPFVHTSAILVRNTIFKDGLPNCYFDVVGTFEECALRGEDFRRVLHLEKGPMYIMPELVSVYRIHSKGIWQGSTSAHKAIEGAIGANFYAKYFAERYGNAFRSRARVEYNYMMSHLVINEKILDTCALESRDIALLSALMLDMQKHQDETKVEAYSKMKLFILMFIQLLYFP